MIFIFDLMLTHSFLNGVKIFLVIYKVSHNLCLPLYNLKYQFFSGIFLHGSIDLVELYKTEYIKKFLRYLFGMKNSKKLLEKSQKMLQKLIFYMEQKHSVFR